MHVFFAFQDVSEIAANLFKTFTLFGVKSLGNLFIEAVLTLEQTELLAHLFQLLLVHFTGLLQLGNYLQLHKHALLVTLIGLFQSSSLLTDQLEVLFEGVKVNNF